MDSLEAEMDIIVKEGTKIQRPGKINGIINHHEEELLDKIVNETGK
jgi:hypothetical protein